MSANFHAVICCPSCRQANSVGAANLPNGTPWNCSRCGHLLAKWLTDYDDGQFFPVASARVSEGGRVAGSGGGRGVALRALPLRAGVGQLC